MTQNYVVLVSREGDSWLADVPEVEGTHTYARTLVGLARNVREAVAVALDLTDSAEAELSLAWEIHSGQDELDRQAAELRALRQKVQAAEEEIQRRTQALAPKLCALWPVRDTAVMLGVSPQRVSQLSQQVAS